MSESRFKFGRYMKELRLRKGLSKKRASIALGYKSDGMINTIEQGFGPIPIEKIHPISRLYDIDPDEIIEKLRDCEPELHEKYMQLQRDISRHLVDRIGKIESHEKAEIARRWKGPMSDNLTYVNHSSVWNWNLYIMSTWGSMPKYQLSFDFKPRYSNIIHLKDHQKAHVSPDSPYMTARGLL